MKSEKIINLSFFLALGIVWQHSRLPWIPETTFHPFFLFAMQITNKMMEVIVPCNHGKTICDAFQKRNVYFPIKNEM
jgi:hypothetical protein